MSSGSGEGRKWFLPPHPLLSHEVCSARCSEQNAALPQERLAVVMEVMPRGGIRVFPGPSNGTS